MRTRTRVLAAGAAALFAAGGVGVGLAADSHTADNPHAAAAMHTQIGTESMSMHSRGGQSMHTMHDSIDPSAMEEMHAATVNQLPAELRDDADAMHQSVTSLHGAKAAASSGDTLTSHHPTGREPRPNTRS